MRNRWVIHDIVIGLLAGAGVGSIVGVIIAVRVSDNSIITLIGAILGAFVGLYALMRTHRSGERFLTATVVIVWILLVLSAGFIALLVNAIVNFE